LEGDAPSCTVHESCSSTPSVVGGLAEAATGPPSPASAMRDPGQSLTPECETRDANSGGCGFELAIPNQGNYPANKAPPPPDLASLRRRETDPDQFRGNRGSCLGCEPTAVPRTLQEGGSSPGVHGGPPSTFGLDSQDWCKVQLSASRLRCQASADKRPVRFALCERCSSV